jgi:hypothetical protein
MGYDFYKTRMGAQFYEGTMPRIAAALEDLAHTARQRAKLDEALAPAGGDDPVDPSGVTRPPAETATEEFRRLCLTNGLDPDDRSYGSKTLNAWMWFMLGRDGRDPFGGDS